MTDKKQPSENPVLPSMSITEGEDFYINDKGLFVFTETYHLKRGYCCKNGCLHCPYDFKNKNVGQLQM
jgi:Family of unknown function (DUF5522)